MTSFSSNPSHRAAFLGWLRGVRSSADSPGGCFPSIESSPRKKLVRVAPHQRTSVSVLTWHSLMTLWVHRRSSEQSWAVYVCYSHVSVSKGPWSPQLCFSQGSGWASAPLWGSWARKVGQLCDSLCSCLIHWRHWLHRQTWQTIKPQHFVCKASIFLTRPRWHRLVASG